MALITHHRPLLRQFPYLFGALLLFGSCMLVLFSLTYTSLCYSTQQLPQHHDPNSTSEVNYQFTTAQYSCSINQFYYQTVTNESTAAAAASTSVEVSSKDDDLALSLLSAAQTQDKIKRLRNIARYGEVCGDDVGNGGIAIPADAEPSQDFYAKVRQETEQPDKINVEQDLATVLLPKYSNDISLNNISNTLYLYYAFHPSSDRVAQRHEPQKPMNLTIIGIALREIYCPNKSLDNEDQPPPIDRILFCAFEEEGGDHHGNHQHHHHSTEYRTNASIECLPEGHDQRYSSVMLNCRVPGRLRSRKLSHLSSVRIIERNTNRSHSHVAGPVQIVNNDSARGHYEQSDTFSEQTNNNNNNNDITVCVRPMFGHINILNLLEFIAFYRTNGVSRVVLYHYDFAYTTNSSGTMSRAVRFLKFLSSLTGVRLHRFVLPKSVESDVHAGAQIVTVHDCLLRYPNSVQIHVDIDEFVFAQPMEQNGEQRKTIRQWVQSQLATKSSHVALYVASVLHCHEFNLNHSTYYEFDFGIRSHCKGHPECSNREKNHFYHTLNSSTVKRALIVSNNALCQRTVWPHEVRSKVVLLRPKLVKHMGIHNVWKFDEDHVISGERGGFLSGIKRQLARINPFRKGVNESNYTTATQPPMQYYSYLKIDPTEAILRHYRWCCQIQQSYFFDLLHFYSVEDAVVRASVVPSPVSNNQTRPTILSHIKTSSSPSTYHLTTQVESYVLRHFELFLQKTKASRRTTRDNSNAEF